MHRRVGERSTTFADVFDGLSSRLLRSDPSPVGVALSGGGDSAALLLLAAEWAASAGRPLLALHVDHQLNPASAQWTETAAALASRVGAGFVTLNWVGEKPAAGLPAAARRARHALLADAARAAGARVILMGHTLNDVAEADLMRAATPALGRLKPWAPSPVWPEGRDVFLLRPLLTTSRQALRRLLSAESAPYVEDPANVDPRFARARARRALAEAPTDAPVAAQGPTPGADEVSVLPDGSVHIPSSALQRGGAALLGPAILAASGGERPPRGAALARLLARPSNAVAAALAGAQIVADGSGLWLYRESGDYRRRGLPVLDVAAGAAVFDGRFLIEASAPVRISPAAGSLSRLEPAERERLARIAARARPGLPLAWDGARLATPYPFGTAPARATALAGPRLTAAYGLVAHESEISRKSMAEPRRTPYVRAEGTSRALRQ